MHRKYILIWLLIFTLIGFVHAENMNVTNQSQGSVCDSGSCQNPSDMTLAETVTTQENILSNETMCSASRALQETMNSQLYATNTVESLSSSSGWDVAVRFDNAPGNSFYPFSISPGIVGTPYYAQLTTSDNTLKWIPYCFRGCGWETCYWAIISRQACEQLSTPCESLDPATTGCICYGGIKNAARIDGWFVERQRITDNLYHIKIRGQSLYQADPRGELWLNPDSGWKFTQVISCGVEQDEGSYPRPTSCGLVNDTMLRFQAAGDCASSCACEDAGGIGIDVIAEKGGVIISPPVADFTATPTSGNAALPVQFTDISTGSPTSWSWNFGDSQTSTQRNPLHTYSTTGKYTVSLTAANTAGSNTVTKRGYVTVSGKTVNYYVFADGVALYHGLDGNLDLPGADTTAQYFYNQMTTGQNRCQQYKGTTYCWDGRNNPVNDNTGSKYWNKLELADTSGANSAEFSFHVGHGWEDGIVFGTLNNFKNTTRSDMRFSRVKWVAFDSCKVLNQSRSGSWGSVFDGVHIIMGFDTDGIPKTDQGPQFVERMRGGTYQGNPYIVTKIRDAWMYTMQDTTHDSTLKGAWIWAVPSQDDYLPGYGPFKEPTKSNGAYTIIWDNFICN